MKKYNSLGELLVDYRTLNGLSQFDLASKLDVDHRSILRWEKDVTLIKSEKEKELVEQTFIPYQVIRNLNATVPIPVYYDFKIRKYSMSEMAIGMPDAQTIKIHQNAVSPRIYPIDTDSESNIDLILRFYNYAYKTDKQVNKKLIIEAAKRLPELNLIMYDHAGFYAGHCVFFPVRNSTYLKLRNREIVEGEIQESDLVNYRSEEVPIFYGYSIYADCNENLHYLMNALLNFLKDQKSYLISALVIRPDAIPMLNSFGIRKVWEENDFGAEDKRSFSPTFMEGKFNDIEN